MSILHTLTTGFTELRTRAEQRALFRRDLFAAIADGKLTDEEMAELESERDAYGLTADDISGIRLQLYLHAYETVSADKKITEDEWKELEKIQAFLGIEDAEIEPTKRELLSMHILHEVRTGRLPIIEVATFALQKGETAHWEEPVWFTHREKKGESGSLVVTSKRVVFRSPDESIAVRLPSILHVHELPDGVRIVENAKEPKEFRSRRKGSARILRSILIQAMRQYGQD